MELENKIFDELYKEIDGSKLSHVARNKFTKDKLLKATRKVCFEDFVKKIQNGEYKEIDK
jgi:hypothetical protein